MAKFFVGSPGYASAPDDVDAEHLAAHVAGILRGPAGRRHPAVVVVAERAVARGDVEIVACVARGGGVEADPVDGVIVLRVVIVLQDDAASRTCRRRSRVLFDAVEATVLPGSALTRTSCGSRALRPC